MNLKKNIIIDSIPNHIAIIMDGNGRWAKQKNKSYSKFSVGACNWVFKFIRGDIYIGEFFEGDMTRNF